ncbi:hypothetical protein BH09ACT12_BH09ACT12_03150 [soil metagenome]
MSYNQPPPPPGYGGSEGGYGAVPQGNNQKAIWSLVTGILGILCCGILGPVAIFLANTAKKEMGNGQQGGGLATAGLILGIIGSVLLVLQIILLSTGNFYFNVN